MQNDFAREANPPPAPKPGFESELIQELTTLFSQLATGTATLHVGRSPMHPEWPEPFFTVVPANPKAARLSGAAVVTDLNLTIAEVECELIGFAQGGTPVAGATWQEELRWIWDAVVKGGFLQRQSVDAKGKVIGGASRILINGKEWHFRGGRKAEKLFGKPKYRTVLYEPYVPLVKPD
jgi:hypothetical protein